MTVILFVTASIFLTFWIAKVDAEHINKKEYIKSHTSRYINRLSIALVVSIVNPLYGAAFALIFWAFFDQFLNKLRALDLWYLGTVAKSDLFFKDKIVLYIFTKAMSLMLAILILLFQFTIKGWIL